MIACKSSEILLLHQWGFKWKTSEEEEKCLIHPHVNYNISATLLALQPKNHINTGQVVFNDIVKSLKINVCAIIKSFKTQKHIVLLGSYVQSYNYQ